MEKTRVSRPDLGKIFAVMMVALLGKDIFVDGLNDPKTTSQSYLDGTVVVECTQKVLFSRKATLRVKFYERGEWKLSFYNNYVNDSEVEPPLPNKDIIVSLGDAPREFIYQLDGIPWMVAITVKKLDGPAPVMETKRFPAN